MSQSQVIHWLLMSRAVEQAEDELRVRRRRRHMMAGRPQIRSLVGRLIALFIWDLRNGITMSLALTGGVRPTICYSRRLCSREQPSQGGIELSSSLENSVLYFVWHDHSAWLSL